MIKYTLFFSFLLCLLISACSNDSVEGLLENTDGCREEIEYSKTIRPLIKSTCAVKSCHVAGEDDPELTSYEMIKDNLKDIEKEVAAKEMPKKGSGYTITDEEREAILCWIKQGGLKN